MRCRKISMSIEHVRAYKQGELLVEDANLKLSAQRYSYLSQYFWMAKARLDEARTNKSFGTRWERYVVRTEDFGLHDRYAPIRENLYKNNALMSSHGLSPISIYEARYIFGLSSDDIVEAIQGRQNSHSTEDLASLLRVHASWVREPSRGIIMSKVGRSHNSPTDPALILFGDKWVQEDKETGPETLDVKAMRAVRLFETRRAVSDLTYKSALRYLNRNPSQRIRKIQEEWIAGKSFYLLTVLYSPWEVFCAGLGTEDCCNPFRLSAIITENNLSDAEVYKQTGLDTEALEGVFATMDNPFTDFTDFVEEDEWTQDRSQLWSGRRKVVTPPKVIMRKAITCRVPAHKLSDAPSVQEVFGVSAYPAKDTKFAKTVDLYNQGRRAAGAQVAAYKYKVRATRRDAPNSQKSRFLSILPDWRSGVSLASMLQHYTPFEMLAAGINVNAISANPYRVARLVKVSTYTKVAKTLGVDESALRKAVHNRGNVAKTTLAFGNRTRRFNTSLIDNVQEMSEALGISTNLVYDLCWIFDRTLAKYPSVQEAPEEAAPVTEAAPEVKPVLDTTVRPEALVRLAVGTDPDKAVLFALNVSGKPDPITRSIACGKSEAALAYATKVDKKVTPSTLGSQDATTLPLYAKALMGIDVTGTPSDWMDRYTSFLRGQE